jgi:hypothetical protein
MPISPKLRTASTIMAWLSLLGAVLVAVSVSIGTLWPVELVNHGSLKLVIQFKLPNGMVVTQAMPLLYRAAVFLTALVPAGLTIWMLLSLFRLFRLLAASRVFDSVALLCISRAASLLFWMVLAQIFAQPVIWFIISRAAGQFWTGYLITGAELPSLFAAGVLVVIARVMAEARRIADENATFI